MGLSVGDTLGMAMSHDCGTQMAKRCVARRSGEYITQRGRETATTAANIHNNRQFSSVQFRIQDDVIDVNTPNRGALLDAVRGRFQSRQGFALATLNLDHLVKLRADPAFRAAYVAQDFIVADGNPVVWLSRLARQPVALVTGSDLLRPMLALAAAEGVRVGFFGSVPEVLDGAKTRLMAEIPGLDVVWTGSPGMGFDPEGPEAMAALHGMAQAGVGLCILSLSAPKQERFAILGRKLAPATGFCSFGAGLDFIVGQQVRAPEWVRAVAMEWLWRALSQPKRMIPRYAACAAILPGLVVGALRQRV